MLGQLAWLHALMGRCRPAETAIDQARAQAPLLDVTLERWPLKVYFFCYRFDRDVEVATRLANLAVVPRLATLRIDPRFALLRTRIGL